MNKDKFVRLSEIHANLTALKAVLSDIQAQGYLPDAVVILGDIINYGMRPNEVISELEKLSYPIVVNLMGNHEKALLDGDLSHFSTERGKQMLQYTSSILSESSLLYIKENMISTGLHAIECQGKHLLFLHGSINDVFWGKLGPDAFSNIYYSNYDYVFSGHTHLPHNMSCFYPDECPRLRNKKKTVFINPGSVGQPRNQNPCAQYVYFELSTGKVHYNAVKYDVEAEYRLYPDFLDVFYKERLILGV